MTTIEAINCHNTTPQIPHKTPPSPERPQPNNQSSIIPNQSNPQTAHAAQFNRKLQPLLCKTNPISKKPEST